MFVIEKSIPLPEGAENAGVRLPKYPFADLDVGDSFFTPRVEGMEAKAFRARVNNAKNAAGKRLERVFVSRDATHVSEAGEVIEGVRVWRVR